VLAPAQVGDGFSISRITDEVIAAKPFQRPDLAVEQSGGEVSERVGDYSRSPGPVPCLELRTTGRAGRRLGVEAAVGRVVVLRPASGAHGEGGHHGPLVVLP
jgi:hypothetical protein